MANRYIEFKHKPLDYIWRSVYSTWILPVSVLYHYDDVVMGAIASLITSFTIVYSAVYSDADQRKPQNSASLTFVRGIHRGPVNSHKCPVTRKMFPFDDVIMVWEAGTRLNIEMPSCQCSHYKDKTIMGISYLERLSLCWNRAQNSYASTNVYLTQSPAVCKVYQGYQYDFVKSVRSRESHLHSSSKF